MEPEDLIARLRAAKVPHTRIAEALGRAQPAATRLLNGQRSLKADEMAKLLPLLQEVNQSAAPEYEAIEVLPTYAGAGGGGNGDGDHETALVPRALIREILRGRPTDFILITIRGDSMEPDFHHGDQLLIDQRDRNPTQPGPFALLGEGAYVVKNVQRTRERLRIFSSNPKYSDEQLDPEQVSILGRPVWFGRQL